MELRRQWAVLRRSLVLIVAGTVLALVAAFVISGVVPRVYEAQATLLVGQSLTSINPDYNQLLASQRLSQTYAQLATFRPILERVIAGLGLGTTPDKLVQRVRADVPRDSTLIRIVVQDGDPQQAAAIANAVAQELVAASPALQGRESDLLEAVNADLQGIRDDILSTQAALARLTTKLDRTLEDETQIQALQARLLTLRTTHASLLTFSTSTSVNQLSIVEPAITSTEPVSPKLLINMLVTLVLALVLFIALAFVRDHLDDTVKGAEDLEPLVDLPVLGQVARIDGMPAHSDIYRLVTLLYPRSAAAESFRGLRTNIDFASLESPLHSLLIASTLPEEGKTTMAANLAVVFAQAGRRVLLVDGDLRKPALHRLFRLTNAQGLTTLLRSDSASPESVIRDTEQPLLRVLTTGPLPPNPAELLDSIRMRDVLQQLRAEADLLIFDSPPLQVVTDAAILASKLDRTLLVVQSGRTRRATVKQGRDALSKVGARVIGAVVNRLPVSGNEGSPYYAYYGEPVVPKSGGDAPSDHGPDQAPPDLGEPPVPPARPPKRMARRAAE